MNTPFGNVFIYSGLYTYFRNLLSSAAACTNNDLVAGRSANAFRNPKSWIIPLYLTVVTGDVGLASGTIIKEVYLPNMESNNIAEVVGNRPIKTIEENERDHILSVLKLCNGKVSGVGGAAELLGVPSSTLSSKIKKLGIRKEHFYSSRNDNR